MARIAGIDLPRNKRIEIALTYIYGIGRSTSQEILAKAWPDRPVRCLLVWTDGPKLMELDPEDLRKALNRVLN